MTELSDIRINLSAERLQRVIDVIEMSKDEPVAERTAHFSITALGDFRVGAAVKVLIDLLDHPNEGHRNTARTSLLRIRNAMGALWLDGSLSIIYQSALCNGDRRTRQLAMQAMVDCIPTEMFLRRLVAELRSDEKDMMMSAVRLAAKVSRFDVADRLMDIAFEEMNDELSRMIALESLAGTVRELDINALEYLELMLAVEVDRLGKMYENDNDIDYILWRVDEVFRNIHECLDDMGV